MIWKFILVQVLATQEIQDGVQDGRRFLPIKSKYLVNPRNFIYNDLSNITCISLIFVPVRDKRDPIAAHPRHVNVGTELNI